MRPILILLRVRSAGKVPLYPDDIRMPQSVSADNDHQGPQIISARIFHFLRHHRYPFLRSSRDAKSVANHQDPIHGMLQNLPVRIILRPVVLSAFATEGKFQRNPFKEFIFRSRRIFFSGRRNKAPLETLKEKMIRADREADCLRIPDRMSKSTTGSEQAGVFPTIL